MTDPEAKVFSVVADIIRISGLVADHDEPWQYFRGPCSTLFESAIDRYNEEIRRGREPAPELDGG